MPAVLDYEMDAMPEGVPDRELMLCFSEWWQSSAQVRCRV